MPLTIKQKLAPNWYTPATVDEDDEKPPRFLLRPLTSPEVLEVWEHYDEAKKRVGSTGLLIAAKHSITEWENVENETGKPLKCNRLNIDKLPFFMLAEIGGEAVQRSLVEEAEAKNS